MTADKFRITLIKSITDSSLGDLGISDILQFCQREARPWTNNPLLQFLTCATVAVGEWASQTKKRIESSPTIMNARSWGHCTNYAPSIFTATIAGSFESMGSFSQESILSNNSEFEMPRWYLRITVSVPSVYVAVSWPSSQTPVYSVPRLQHRMRPS